MYISFPLSSLTEELEAGKGTEAMNPDSILLVHHGDFTTVSPLTLHWETDKVFQANEN